MRWGERAARNSLKACDVQPPGSHVTLAPNCPYMGFKEPQIHSGHELTPEVRPEARCWTPRALPSV